MTDTRQMRFGLLGRSLGHSWSPQIHAQLGSIPYDLIEKEPDEVEGFLRSGEWEGLNVTIPYKREAARIADVRSARVEALGAANTLTRDDGGRIVAENTDVLGFSWMARRFAERELGCTLAQACQGGEALVLGSGGASKAVVAALESEMGIRTSVISRSGSDSYEGLIDRHPHARIIVNTTPVGMYPHCPESPLSDDVIAGFSELRAILDVVYNPERTGICLAAERLGIPCESGLAMLVAQAHYASELFQGHSLDEARIEQIVSDILATQRNIVLIGMPGAGKTTTGRALAHLLGRPFVDLDDAFAVEMGMDAASYIQQHGERAFRDRESEVAASYGAQSGLVIACGGGIVTRIRNYDLIHQNGTICFVDRPLEELSSSGRPLSQQKGVQRLAEERMDLYRSWADVSLTCTGSGSGDAALLVDLLGLKRS